jgi:PAS domain S-box-containing protein
LLAAILAAVAVIPLLGFGWLCAELFTREIKNQSLSRNRLLAQTLAANVDELLTFVGTELRAIAETTRLQRDTSYGHLNQNFLQAALNQHPLLEAVRVADSQGRIYLSSIPGDHLLGSTSHEDPALLNPQEVGASFWLSPYRYDINLRVTVAACVRFVDGTVVGYVKMQKLRALIERIHRARGKEELVFMTDASGVLLAHTDETLLSQQVNHRDLPIVAQGLSRGEFSAVYDLNGHRHFGSAVRVASTGWLVVVSQPVEVAYALAEQLRTFLIWGTLVALAAALVLSYWLSDRLLKPLIDLTVYTQKIARGEYSDTLPADCRYTELQTLSSAFATMVGAVKDRERSLKSSEAKYSGLLERLNEAIYRFSLPEGSCEYISPAVASVFGYSRDQFENVPLMMGKIIHPESRTWFEGEWAKIKRGEVAHSFEYRITDAAGATRWIYQTNAAVLDGRGRIVAVESCCNNVTARKEAEAELAKYRDQLEEMVKERTEDLKAAQAGLIKNEKLSVLGRLTATVSHELRNPLGVIRSSAYYLSRTFAQNDPKITKHLQRIEDQVKVCDVIVGDLLEYTRGRTSSISLGDLNQLVRQIASMIQRPGEVKLNLELCTELPSVAFDREKLTSVINNVVHNAIQAVIEKSEKIPAPSDYTPTVIIRTHRHGGVVVIEVVDNGPGIEADVLPRVFEPLFTTRARGTGLGLAIVQKIVHEHNGNVGIQSRIGEGTTFTIRLDSTDKRISPMESNGTSTE